MSCKYLYLLNYSILGATSLLSVFSESKTLLLVTLAVVNIVYLLIKNLNLNLKEFEFERI